MYVVETESGLSQVNRCHRHRDIVIFPSCCAVSVTSQRYSQHLTLSVEKGNRKVTLRIEEHKAKIIPFFFLSLSWVHISKTPFWFIVLLTYKMSEAFEFVRQSRFCSSSFAFRWCCWYCTFYRMLYEFSNQRSAS